MLKTKGFSVLEVLVVTFILLVFVGLTVFYLAPQRRQIKTEDAARIVYNTMREARILSITRRIYYGVVINTNATPQTISLSNSTLSFTFPAKSVSLVDMGLLNNQTDQHIQTTSIYPNDIVINPSDTVNYYIPNKTGFPALEASFPDGVLPSNNMFICYFDPAGRVLDAATEQGNQIYRIFYFCPQQENKGAATNTLTSATVQGLTRAITLYGATGGINFWRYESPNWKSNRQ